MPTFHNRTLQAAFDHARPEIEGRDTFLNGLSDDIKNLEAYLNDQKCFSWVEIPVGSGDITSPNPSDPEGSPICGDPLEMVSERLVFMESSAKDGRWRIFYQKVQAHGTLAEGPEWQPEEKVLESRPLIETPIEIRVRCRNFLPQLLNLVAIQSSPDPDGLRQKWEHEALWESDPRSHI